MFNTRSGGQYRPDNVALAFALSLREHDSATTWAGWPAAWRTRCLEQQPNTKRLARETDDTKVFDAAKIISRVCDLLNIGPGATFVRNGSDHAYDGTAP